MDNKNFLEGIKKIFKKMSRNKKLKKYYLERMRSGKTYMAMLFDGVLFKLIFLLITYVFFYIRTESIWFSGIISVQFVILYILVFYKVRKIRLSKAKEKIDYQVAKKKIYKDLINQPPYEFIEEIKTNLEKCEISDLEISNDRDIELIGYFKNNKIAIKCLQFSSDYKVNTNVVREFFLALKRNKLDEGIIITTSSFSEDAKAFLPKLEEHADIHTINMENLINIKKKAKTYPTEKEIEKIILNQIADKKRKLKEYRDTVLSKGKSTKYFLLALIIFFFGKITPYQLYYRIVSVILVALGIVSITKYLVELLEPKEGKKNQDIFQ